MSNDTGISEYKKRQVQDKILLHPNGVMFSAFPLSEKSTKRKNFLGYLFKKIPKIPN